RSRLERPDLLGALEPFGEQVHDRRVQVVDAGAEGLERRQCVLVGPVRPGPGHGAGSRRIHRTSVSAAGPPLRAAPGRDRPGPHDRAPGGYREGMSIPGPDPLPEPPSPRPDPPATPEPPTPRPDPLPPVPGPDIPEPPDPDVAPAPA